MGTKVLKYIYDLMHTCVVERQKKNDALNCIKIKDLSVFPPH